MLIGKSQLEPLGRRLRDVVPQGIDPFALLFLTAAGLAMFLPTYRALAAGVWATDEQGHGPIIIAVCMWLVFRKRVELAAFAETSKVSNALGWLIFSFALLIFIVGRTQDVLALEVISQILILVGLVLLFRGAAGLRLIWFPLAFLAFTVPLPETLVSAVTAPLKNAVSFVASGLLHEMGYPVGRSGVVLTVGQYQLLVADACAGLNSMFTLEALGMLYMNLMNYKSVGRNTTLAILLIPIAFIANIVRVLILVLVTYYFGDEAGQGFVHGFAGMVLFMVALAMMLVVDKALGLCFESERREK